MGKLLRETLKLVKVVVNGVAAVGPVINTVTDSTSKAINGSSAPAEPSCWAA